MSGGEKALGSRPVDARTLLHLSDHLLAMHGAEDLDSLFTSATTGLEHLIPCDWASVSYSPSSEHGQRRFWSRYRADQERVSGPAQEFYAQHPLWLEWHRELIDFPTHMDRTVSDHDLERLDIYHTVFKPLGIRRMLGSCMPAGVDVAFALCRDSRSAFADQDAMVLDVIGKHLALAVKRLREPGRGVVNIRGEAEPVSEFGLLALSPSGALIGATTMARAMLREHFGDLHPKALPARLGVWLAAGATQPLRIVGEVSDLVATVSGAAEALGLRRVLLKSTPKRDRDGVGRAMAHLGLTPREREVARWVAAGKTNPEIAAILGTRPATAKKHVERILQKAGVENRASLVVALLDPQM